VSIFIVDAGRRGVPALYANSVSPRVRETAMIPNCPLRILAAIEPISARSDSTERGVVNRIAGAAGATGRLTVFFFLARDVDDFVVFFFLVPV
jgi:hypothetical protein